ncbi:HEPN domain-containing protein [Halopseudomonas xiamenensis]|uniref:HEPN domain-containing protein n=1 Tax=Halopseudomonas xiamenensis TaxID=157792 RepID=UPI001623896F|nr:HEPN domain-containing protein [Halopseudomonas xiamenensis]
MTFQALKQRHRQERDEQHENLRLRIHRALSWLQRAEMADDADGRFIFLWIAFNAAYATEIDDHLRLSEQETFKAFLQKLCSLDTAKRIDALVWQEFSGSIRVLLDNPYVFQSFWDHQSGKINEETWKKRFSGGKAAAQQALASGNTPALLGVLFNRLYTLRNQLIHGGATWNGAVNRQQMRDCTNLLGKLVPLILELMMDSPNTLWGDACYPVVNV